MSYEIQAEAAEDAAAIAALIDASFGPERLKRTVHRFRDGRAPIPGLGFVGRADGIIVGSIRFWMAQLPDTCPVPLLGPLAVDPSLRGYGVGRALVRWGIDAVAARGHPAILIVGDPGYYAPFGFTVASVAGLTMPGPVGPLSFMGLELEEGRLSRLSGPVVPPPA